MLTKYKKMSTSEKIKREKVSSESVMKDIKSILSIFGFRDR